MDIAVLLVTAIFYLVGILIAYHVIRSAVRGAILDAYKTKRWYEHTNAWVVGNFGSAAPRNLEEALGNGPAYGTSER